MRDERKPQTNFLLWICKAGWGTLFSDLANLAYVILTAKFPTEEKFWVFDGLSVLLWNHEM